MFPKYGSGNLPFLIGSDVLQEVFDVLVVAHFAVVLLDVFDRLVMSHDVTLSAYHLHHVLARTSDYFGQLQLRKLKDIIT